MIDLIEPGGNCHHSYSDSFNLMEAVQDAFQHGYLHANHFFAVWPAAAERNGEYEIIAFCYDGAVEITGYLLRVR